MTALKIFFWSKWFTFPAGTVFSELIFHIFLMSHFSFSLKYAWKPAIRFTWHWMERRCLTKFSQSRYCSTVTDGNKQTKKNKTNKRGEKTKKKKKQKQSELDVFMDLWLWKLITNTFWSRCIYGFHYIGFRWAVWTILISFQGSLTKSEDGSR